MIRILIVAAIIIAIAASIFLYHPRHPGNLAKPAADLSAWHWDQQATTSGGVSVDGDAIRCDVLQIDGVPYHLELFQHNISLINGRSYHVHFKAKANHTTVIKLVSVINHPDWHPLGLDEELGVTTAWKDYDYTFRAQSTDGQKDKLPSFFLGYSISTIWFKDILVEEA